MGAVVAHLVSMPVAGSRPTVTYAEQRCAAYRVDPRADDLTQERQRGGTRHTGTAPLVRLGLGHAVSTNDVCK